jgi:hypothetical protein
MKSLGIGILLGLLILSLIFYIKHLLEIRKFRKQEEKFNRKCDEIEKKIRNIYENEYKRCN